MRPIASLFVLSLLIGCSGMMETTKDEPQEPARPEDTVVHIFYANPDSPNQRQASGTGFVVDVGDGVIVTAAHVVEAEGLIDIKFGKPDGTGAVFLPARVVTRDRDRDIALLRVDLEKAKAERMVRPAELVQDEVAVQIGNSVAIYGFPESDIVGLEMRRSSGTVSSLRSNPINRGDRVTKMIELEAKIEPGNSGSPVFNEQNRVVGVVSSRWKTTDSYALATPVTVVLDLIEHRYEDDMEMVIAEIKEIPTTYMAQVKTAYELSIKMRNVFPQNSEGERIVAQLEHCMGRALREGELGKNALDEGDIATAWRHLQILRYEARAHQQDIAFLKSAQQSLGISIIGSPGAAAKN